jgi:hypothetical protein
MQVLLTHQARTRADHEQDDAGDKEPGDLGQAQGAATRKLSCYKQSRLVLPPPPL